MCSSQFIEDAATALPQSTGDGHTSPHDPPLAFAAVGLDQSVQQISGYKFASAFAATFCSRV